MSETDVVRACLELLKLRKIPAWRNNTTGVFDPTTRRFRKFTGLKGVSDILGLIPKSGRLLAVECKDGKGRVSPDQRAFLDMVVEANGYAVVVWSAGELNAYLDEVNLGK